MKSSPLYGSNALLFFILVDLPPARICSAAAAMLAAALPAPTTSSRETRLRSTWESPMRRRSPVTPSARAMQACGVAAATAAAKIRRAAPLRALARSGSSMRKVSAAGQ